MDYYINKEFTEFSQCHKNIYNIIFHIACGIIYITLFLLLFENKKFIILFIYFLIILFTTHIIISLTIFIIIFILLSISNKCKFNVIYLLLGGTLFYFLPELSHYITNEKTVLNINNLTITNIIFNIFYLLPFSLMCLTNSK